GRSLITMGVDGLRVWDVATGKSLHRLPYRNGCSVNLGLLSPDGKQVVTVEQGRNQPFLRLWEVPTGRLLREFGDHYCIAGCFSPDGKLLATLGSVQPNDLRYRGSVNLVNLWDLATGQRLQSWEGHKDGAYCGVFTA